MLNYKIVYDRDRIYDATRYYLNNEDDLLELKSRLNDLIEHEEIVGACGYRVIVKDWFSEDNYFYIDTVEYDYFDEYPDDEDFENIDSFTHILDENFEDGYIDFYGRAQNCIGHLTPEIVNGVMVF